jgi:hypothetical protein
MVLRLVVHYFLLNRIAGRVKSIVFFMLLAGLMVSKLFEMDGLRKIFGIKANEVYSRLFQIFLCIEVPINTNNATLYILSFIGRPSFIVICVGSFEPSSGIFLCININNSSRSNCDGGGCNDHDQW